MSQKSQTGGISFLGVVDVKRTKLLEKRTFGGIATQKFHKKSDISSLSTKTKYNTMALEAE
jgi:hypothetical protein